jgi:hypothetical protein
MARSNVSEQVVIGRVWVNRSVFRQDNQSFAQRRISATSLALMDGPSRATVWCHI